MGEVDRGKNICPLYAASKQFLKADDEDYQSFFKKGTL